MGKGITGVTTAIDSSSALACPPTLFLTRCLSQRQHGFRLTCSGPCKAVATILIGIVPVPPDPRPTYFVACDMGVQLSPKVLVEHDLPHGGFSSLCLPARPSLRSFSQQVLRT